MDIVDLIKTFGSIAGSITSIAAVLALVLKPVRNKIIIWIKDSVGLENILNTINEVSSIKENITTIGEKLDNHIFREDERKVYMEHRDKIIDEINVNLQQHIEESNLERELNKEADLFTIKNYVIDTHKKCVNEGCISRNRKETLLIGFDLYTKRNGNSFVHELIDEILKLPTCDKE